ncbi:hypothetical protein CEXT_297651 [Caerostris extrusa]|uniref:Uncharacterized protein n=1 Tax=Caerostris extrusa TaxID=172846 RepID=A0AAV4YEG3_CAEEX|nr:hypothetical protein CEXT_297651 [Caerostris extrusa]
MSIFHKNSIKWRVVSEILPPEDLVTLRTGDLQLANPTEVVICNSHRKVWSDYLGDDPEFGKLQGENKRLQFDTLSPGPDPFLSAPGGEGRVKKIHAGVFLSTLLGMPLVPSTDILSRALLSFTHVAVAIHSERQNFPSTRNSGAIHSEEEEGSTSSRITRTRTVWGDRLRRPLVGEEAQRR